MSSPPRFVRPATPAGFDPSRAAERAAAPAGWRYAESERAAVHRVIAERRDIRRFRPDPIPAEVLDRILAAAHRAPSVGLMQPWRLIVIESLETRAAVRALAARERIAQASRFDARARQFLDQKIEGVVEAPLGICVCCDHGESGVEILGRSTIPETDVYSTACAVENLMLAARAEGVGVGWVSFYRPEDLRAVLGIPDRADPIAWLCLGWPDERPVRPGLEAAGWSERLPLGAVVMRERWAEKPGSAAQRSAAQPAGERCSPSAARSAAGPASLARPRTVRRDAAIAARDRLDTLVKPAGSLGALEAAIERWAIAAGSPPPERIRAGILICAADHGHAVHGTSLFDPAVSGQVAAAAVRGETAIGVLAARGAHELLVADLGLSAGTPPGVNGRFRLGAGSADMTSGPAMTGEQLEAALAAGAALAAELAARGVDCLVLGEIGIGNTTSAAALACALTGAAPEAVAGRGTGLDTAGMARKRALLAGALARHGLGSLARGPDGARAALARVGGLELAALAGAIAVAPRLGLPLILDGFAVGAAALAAVRLEPLAAEHLIAGHRSAEPGHGAVLEELGLEALLDLRLRLGEASGAALALPLLEAAGALHRRMGTFAEAGVAGPPRARLG